MQCPQCRRDVVETTSHDGGVSYSYCPDCQPNYHDYGLLVTVGWVVLIFVGIVLSPVVWLGKQLR